MPRVYRLMRKDEDGLPVVEESARGLGVRPGVDVDIDAGGAVLANSKGMSVNPNWRSMNPNFIPKRLKDLHYGARGSNNAHCFRSGEGLFQAGEFADGLVLIPDSERHGVIAPEATTPLAAYEAALAATRPDWIIDET